MKHHLRYKHGLTIIKIMFYDITIKIKQILHKYYPITNIILNNGTICLMIQSCNVF